MAITIKMYVLIFFLVIVAALAVYYYFSTINFSHNRAEVSRFFCNIIPPRANLKRPVILIPGTKGSLLKENGETVWLSPWQLLPGGKPFIYEPEHNNAKPMGILTRLSIIPGAIEQRFYYGIAAELACSPHAYFFSYDWRENPVEHVTDLGILVEQVRRETGEKPSIIAHSMGGLITHYYMKQHADTVDRVVYVGVPFQPGLGFLTDIDKGTAVGLNYDILSREALFSHPGSFALLPHQGSTQYKNQDLMSSEMWKENELSVYKRNTTDTTMFDHSLEDSLQKAKGFFAALDLPSPMQNKFMFVVGNCEDTLYAVSTSGKEEFRPGDGRVVAEGAYPVEKNQLDKTTLTSCAPHHLQLDNKENIDAILRFLE